MSCSFCKHSFLYKIITAVHYIHLSVISLDCTVVGFEALGSACRAYSFTQCNFLATSGISSPSSFSEGEPRNVFF